MWLDPKRDVISIDDKLKTTDDRFRIFTSQNHEFDLRLSKVKKEDEGEYVCKAVVGENMISQHKFILHIRSIYSFRKFKNVNFIG